MKKGIIILCLFALSCTPKGGNNAIIGIDVSHHQGDIDWDRVKRWKNNKIQFVYMKATEGTTYQDKRYRENFTEALANNLNVGSYHYFRTSSSVDGQFQNFTNHVDKDSQVLIPMVDVEENRNWSNKTFHKNLRKFLVMVERHYGKKPIIYCVNSFYNEHFLFGYRDYQFMIGRYNIKQPKMILGDWTIWQFTERGEVEGIQRRVDIDKLNAGITLDDISMKTVNNVYN